MPDYSIHGKDGKLYRFVGVSHPPSADEMDAIEQSTAPKGGPSIYDRVAKMAMHPMTSVVPQDTQMAAISKIAGSKQQPIDIPTDPTSGSQGLPLSTLLDTLKTAMQQPAASARGFGAGAAEGAMNLLTPLNIGTTLAGPAIGRAVGNAAGPVARSIKAVASPSGFLGDVEATGTLSPGKLGAQMLKRVAGAAKGTGAEAVSKIPTELREAYAQLESKFGKDIADTWLNRQKTPTEPARGSVPPTPPRTPTSASAPTGQASPAPEASTSHAGKAPPGRTLEPPNPAVDEVVNRMNGGTDTPPKGNGTFDKAIDQKSQDIGAERLGREFKTRPNSPDAKQDVRDVRTHDQGVAAPHIPNQPRTQILNKMINLPDEARDAYVAKAPDLKTRTQLETMLKTVRHIEGKLPKATTIADVLKKYGTSSE